MAEKDDEAKAWPACKAVAEASVTFVDKFLGLRKNNSDTATLVAADIAHIVDIVRAISWVESKHTTGGGQQPKRDPMQCGNPADLWWKELTGQTGKYDRFVRGPGMSNLDANELPDAADGTAGFEAKASLKKLGADVKKGHDVATFTIEHSYFWAVPILLHKTNSPLGKTYQCGDLSRAWLIDGAVAYNGGGDAKYKAKIENALSLFGGLPVLVA
jgi:hypothetical protein